MWKKNNVLIVTHPIIFLNVLIDDILSIIQVCFLTYNFTACSIIPVGFVCVHDSLACHFSNVELNPEIILNIIFYFSDTIRYNTRQFKA